VVGRVHLLRYADLRRRDGVPLCPGGVYFNPGEMHDTGRRSWLVNEPMGFIPAAPIRGRRAIDGSGATSAEIGACRPGRVRAENDYSPERQLPGSRCQTSPVIRLEVGIIHRSAISLMRGRSIALPRASKLFVLASCHEAREVARRCVPAIIAYSARALSLGRSL
jgi:hypothetical protein